MSDYDMVSGGSLKLKNNLGLSSKSKKKKKKDKLKHRDAIEKALKNSSDSETTINNESNLPTATDKKAWMTEAEKKFLLQQEKRQLSRVMDKASKSHKQRVEDFNSHLESLSEHYDIPKVSWTK